MIDASQLAALQQWGKQQLPQQRMRSLSTLPYGERGSMYWYQFHEPKPLPGEVHSTRPVIILNPDAERRIREGLDLEVVPCSLNTAVTEANTLFTINGRIEGAVHAQVTTINSTKLGKYIGHVNDVDLVKISTALLRHIDKSEKERPSHIFTTGNAFKVRFSDSDNSKVVTIFSRDHLDKAQDISTSITPITVLPVTNLGNADTETLVVKPRPVNYNRLSIKNFEGTAQLASILKAKENFIKICGLNGLA